MDMWNNNIYNQKELDNPKNIVTLRMKKEIFYHGSGLLFQTFDLNHALEGDGKVKFGDGVYVTSVYSSAAHYSGSNSNRDNHYVYTVEIPAKTDDNHIAFKHTVNTIIISKIEAKLHIALPEKAKEDGKELRKFISKLFTPKEISDKKIAGLEGKRQAAKFLLSIGVEFIEWPYSWKNPSLGQNRAIFDDEKVKIVRVDSVDLDEKKKLITDSITKIR